MIIGGVTFPGMTQSHRPRPAEALNPLLVFCCPEGQKVRFPDEWDLPRQFGVWEIALSRSARERGFLKKLSQKWYVFCESEEDALLRKLDAFDLVAVSPLSLNTLAKFALGIRDSFPTRVLGNAAEKGIPILLDGSAVPSGDSVMNPHLSKVYRRHWENVRCGTVSGFDPDSFSTAAATILRNRQELDHGFSSSNRPVVTRDDVILASQAMQPIIVPMGAIVTALAEEEARSRGIQIQFIPGESR